MRTVVSLQRTFWSKRWSLLLAILAFWLATPVAAQIGPALRLPEVTGHTEQAPQRLGSRYLVSPGLYTPEGQAAARAYHRARAEGRLPLFGSKNQSFDVGDTLTFNTERFLKLGWDPRHFTLLFEGDGFHLWVETAERDNGHV